MKHITLHWTAGTYNQTFPEYHFCIKGDGQVVSTLPLSQKGAHCWGRNTGNIGVSLCAMAKGYPVLNLQIERAAKLCAELCVRYGLDPRGAVDLPALHRVGELLIPARGMIVAPVIADHAYFARKDGYWPERWDIGDVYGVVLSKARWYFDKLKAGQAKFEFI